MAMQGQWVYFYPIGYSLKVELKLFTSMVQHTDPVLIKRVTQLKCEMPAKQFFLLIKCM